MTRFSGNAGYVLFWPAEFLVKEIESLILRNPAHGLDWEWVQEAALLLRQAFTSQTPANDFTAVAGAIDARNAHGAADPCAVWLSELSATAINRTLGPRPYHSPRLRDAQTGLAATPAAVAGQVRRPGVIRQVSGSIFCVLS